MKFMENGQRRNWVNAAAASGLVALCTGAMTVGVVYGKLSSKDDEHDKAVVAQADATNRILARVDLTLAAVQASAQRLEMHEYRIGKTEEAIKNQQQTADELKRGMDDVLREIKKP